MAQVSEAAMAAKKANKSKSVKCVVKANKKPTSMKEIATRQMPKKGAPEDGSIATTVVVWPGPHTEYHRVFSHTTRVGQIVVKTTASGHRIEVTTFQ